MLMRKLVWLGMGLSIALVGCGSADRTARLAAGSKAIIAPADGGKTVVLDTASKEGTSTFGSFVLIDAGTKVEVEADEQNPPAEGGNRLVRVFVWDGPDKGKVGELSRDDLLPAD